MLANILYYVANCNENSVSFRSKSKITKLNGNTCKAKAELVAIFPSKPSPGAKTIFPKYGLSLPIQRAKIISNHQTCAKKRYDLMAPEWGN